MYPYSVVILVNKIRINFFYTIHMTQYYKDALNLRIHSFEEFFQCFWVAAILDFGLKNPFLFPIYVNNGDRIQIIYQNGNLVILCFMIVKLYEFYDFLWRPSWICSLESNLIIEQGPETESASKIPTKRVITQLYVQLKDISRILCFRWRPSWISLIYTTF